MKLAEDVLEEVSLRYTGATFPIEITLTAMEEFANQYKPRWTSIQDSLPELNKNVLLFNFDYAVPLYGVGKLKESFIGLEWDLWETEACLYEYTHWMPLPDNRSTGGGTLVQSTKEVPT